MSPEGNLDVGVYEEQVLPRLIDIALRGGELSRIRRRAASGLSGEVLEVGFGSGLNVPFYPDTVTRVRAVDPARVARGLSAKRVAASTVPVEFVGLDGQDLPIEDGSVDHVLVTWTLCTIPDVEVALSEIRRVLRRGGQLHFAEHGRSPDAATASWQDRLTPLQMRLFGGCHLNRQVDTLIESAGFELLELDKRYLSGPKPLTYTFEGRATPT